MLVALSGGVDSTAMALVLHEAGEQFDLMFADTGAEVPETLWMVTQVAARLGKRLHVVSDGSFYQHLAGFGFLLPSMQRRWCTRLLKTAPMDQYAKALGETVAVGITADETRRLRDKPDTMYPLVGHGITKAQARDICKAADLLNPIYGWRSSCSCFCCPFQRVADWQGLYQNHPSLFELACQWEEQGTFTWIKDRSLRNLPGCDPDQLKLWPDDNTQPCVICAH